nr:PREDICTED: NAD(P)(+)--arginine ADP-ribosyltransferase 2-like [Latimeria chalumnae]|eukprot:XP_014353449.1 PREDICTED: NAD(P)(+)--arginine ADP-ribosyltransferase 2-like [Latimeria chalumnae]
MSRQIASQTSVLLQVSGSKKCLLSGILAVGLAAGADWLLFAVLNAAVADVVSLPQLTQPETAWQLLYYQQLPALLRFQLTFSTVTRMRNLGIALLLPTVLILFVISELGHARKFEVEGFDEASEQTPIKMGMMKKSVDDDYKGCARMVNKQIPKILQKERKENPKFDKAWENAKSVWNGNSVHLLPHLKAKHAIAIVAYTSNLIYKDFNANTRDYGTRLRDYPYKAFHFLLTRAVRILSNQHMLLGFRKCNRVFRGTNTEFEAKEGESIRFGQFTSTSKREKVAENFGTRTVFHIKTCYGASIKEYSVYSSEDEVLVPPTEIFKVKKFIKGYQTNKIELKSMRSLSKFRCQLFNATSYAPKTQRMNKSFREVRTMISADSPNYNENEDPWDHPPVSSSFDAVCDL